MGQKKLNPRSREAESAVHLKDRKERLRQQRLSNRASHRQDSFVRLRWYQAKVRADMEKLSYTAEEMQGLFLEFVKHYYAVVYAPELAKAKSPVKAAIINRKLREDLSVVSAGHFLVPDLADCMNVRDLQLWDGKSNTGQGIKLIEMGIPDVHKCLGIEAR